jgi:hypothetical protein
MIFQVKLAFANRETNDVRLRSLAQGGQTG